MELNQLAAAAQLAGRAFLRLLQARGPDDVGLDPLAAVLAGSACITGLAAHELTPAVLVTFVAGFITLLIAVVRVLVSTVARGRRGIGVINFFCAFAALVGAIAAAGVEFDPDTPLKLHNLFFGARG